MTKFDIIFLLINTFYFNANRLLPFDTIRS